MIITITGHRPNKLGGYNANSTTAWVTKSLKKTFKEAVKTYGDVEINVGMAIGSDQIAARVAIELGIPFHAYIPFEGQELKWPEHSQEQFRDILLQAKTMTIVSEGGYAGWKMQKRNSAMVDAGDICIGIWDGSAGGTKNCIDYAIKCEKPLYVLNPKDKTRRWIKRIDKANTKFLKKK